MSNSGLDIGLVEFKKMKAIDRDVLIYNNVIAIRTKIGDYKFHKKFQYVWLLVLTIALGFKKYIGL